MKSYSCSCRNNRRKHMCLHEMAAFFIAAILLVASTSGSFDYSKLKQLDIFSTIKEVKQFVIEDGNENFGLALLFNSSSFMLARAYQPLKIFNFAFIHEIFHLSPLVMSDYHIGRSPPVHQ